MTNSNGQYEIHGVPPDLEGTISITKEGYESVEVGLPPMSSGTFSLCETIRVLRNYDVGGELRLNGRPVSGHVRFEAKPYWRPGVQIPEVRPDGQFITRLTLGDYRVTPMPDGLGFKSDDFARFAFDLSIEGDGPGESELLLDVSMPMVRIEGAVQREDGTPLSGLSLQAIPIPGARSSVTIPSHALAGFLWARTDEGGKFLLELPEGLSSEYWVLPSIGNRPSGRFTPRVAWAREGSTDLAFQRCGRGDVELHLSGLPGAPENPMRLVSAWRRGTLDPPIFETSGWSSGRQPRLYDPFDIIQLCNLPEGIYDFAVDYPSLGAPTWIREVEITKGKVTQAAGHVREAGHITVMLGPATSPTNTWIVPKAIAVRASLTEKSAELSLQRIFGAMRDSYIMEGRLLARGHMGKHRRVLSASLGEGTYEVYAFERSGRVMHCEEVTLLPGGAKVVYLP